MNYPTSTFTVGTRLAAYAITIMILACAGATQAALVRPPVVTFAMYHNMADDILKYDGTQMFAGAKAAEKEINDAGSIYGIRLNISFVPAPSLFAAAGVAAAAAVNLTTNPAYMGSILSDWISSDNIATASVNNASSLFPMIASRHIKDTWFANNRSRFDASLRQPPSSEFLMMMYHAQNADDTRCTSFAVITRYFFPTTTIAATLRSFNLPSPVTIDLGLNAFALPNTTYVLDAWAAGAGNSGYAPMCGMFFTTHADALAILEAMYNDTRFNMSLMTFYASSLTSEGKWNSTLYGTSPYARLHFVTNFADPTHPTNPLPVAFRAAMANWFATVNMTRDVPAEMQQIPFLTMPNYPAFEGYMAVRWLGEILVSMLNFTRSDVLKQIYNRRFFWVNDKTLGPMTDRCLVDSDASLPCYCNVGANVFHITQVPTSLALPVDEGGTASSLSFDLSECTLTSRDVPTALSFAVWYPPGSDAAASRNFRNLQKMLHAQSIRLNDLGTYPQLTVSSALMNDVMPFQTEEQTSDYIHRLFWTRRPTVIIADLFSSVDMPIANMFIAPYTNYTDPPLEVASQYSRNTLRLKPSLADLVHAVVLQVQSEFSITGPRAGRTPKIFVAADNAVGYDLSVKSLHTMQLSVTYGAVSNLSDATTLRQQLRIASMQLSEETTLFSWFPASHRAPLSQTSSTQPWSLRHPCKPQTLTHLQPYQRILFYASRPIKATSRRRSSKWRTSQRCRISPYTSVPTCTHSGSWTTPTGCRRPCCSIRRPMTR